MSRFIVCLLSLVFLLQIPCWAQQNNPTALTVNGQALSPSVVIGPTGGDWAVAVSPILQATGARIQASDGHVEALWSDNTSLVLQLGDSVCTYGGQTINLNTPCGSLGTDLVMPLGDLCTIIGARLEQDPMGGLAVYRDVVISNYAPDQVQARSFPEAGMGGLSSRVTNVSVPYDRPEVSVATIGNHSYTLETPRLGGEIAPIYTSPAPPSNAAVNVSGVSAPELSRYGGGFNPRLQVDQFGMPVGMNGGMGASMNAGTPMGSSMKAGMSGMNSSMGNMAVPNATGTLNGGNTSAIAPGMYGTGGGLGGTLGAPNSSVSARDDGVRYYGSAADSSYASAPQQKYDKDGKPIPPAPAKMTITEFEVNRLMSFHLTAYEIRVRVKNEGEVASTSPIMLKLLAKSKRYDNYELLESYLIDPLQPGAEVEVVKKVDGHQFTCLVDLTINFKVSVLEESLPKEKSKPKNRVRGDDEIAEENQPVFRETCTKEKTTRY